MSWEASREFTAAVAGLYGVLALLTATLFIRKLLQTLQLRSDRNEARLLDDHQQQQQQHAGVGGAAAAEEFQQNYGAPSRSNNNNNMWSMKAKKSGDPTGGGMNRPFVNARNSLPDADDLAPPGSSGRGSINSDLQGSDVGADGCRSEDGGRTVDTMSLGRSRHDSGMSSRRGPYSRSADGRDGLSSSCCESCCQSVRPPVESCCGCLFCMPASFFAERHNSSLFLLGSMFGYSLTRCISIAYMTAQWAESQKGAMTIWAVLVTSFPAFFLMFLQLGFNLKWVVNVRNISASGGGAGFGSRLSLGPSRSALSITTSRVDRSGHHGVDDGGEEEDDDPCSCDLGTASVAMGVSFIIIFPFFAFLCVAAYIEGVRTAKKGDKPNTVEFMGLGDLGWVRVMAAVSAVPYAINGLWTLCLGILLKIVWKPFSAVALAASRNMFIVALVWGLLCSVRGVLLLSYELKNFNDQTHSAWASPAVLMGEGCLIYLVIFVFYLSSRNQDQVVAAEKEARRRISRLERTGGVGAEDVPDQQSSRFLRAGGGAGGPGGKLSAAALSGTNTSKDGTSQGQLGLPIYSTWSSHSQTPSRAPSESFGPRIASATDLVGGGEGQPVQSRLFCEDQ